jgi:hypothetical protein
VGSLRRPVKLTYRFPITTSTPICLICMAPLLSITEQ